MEFEGKITKSEYAAKLKEVYEALSSAIRSGSRLNRTERVCSMIHPYTFERIELLSLLHGQTMSASVDRLLKLGLRVAEEEALRYGTEDYLAEMSEEERRAWLRDYEETNRISTLEQEEGLNFSPTHPFVKWNKK